MRRVIRKWVVYMSMRPIKALRLQYRHESCWSDCTFCVPSMENNYFEITRITFVHAAYHGILQFIHTMTISEMLHILYLQMNISCVKSQQLKNVVVLSTLNVNWLVVIMYLCWFVGKLEVSTIAFAMKVNKLKYKK